jgi:RNase H-fold protein (predicted Holliday junction resolvase)
MFDFIAIDWGSVRTGLSFGSTSTELVIPYDKELFTTDLMEVLEAQIKLKKPTTIVIGKPTNFKLNKTSITLLIEEFIEVLKAKYPDMNYVFINENNTSKNDLKLKNKHTINHNAALVIAKRYLEEL